MVEILIALIILFLAVLIAPILRYSFRVLKVSLGKKFIRVMAEYIFLKTLFRGWFDEWMRKRRLNFFTTKLTVENWMFENLLSREWCNFHGWYCPNPEKCSYEHFDEPQRRGG